MKRLRPLLGTYVEIGCEGGTKRQQALACEAAFAAIAEVQRLLSFHDRCSDLGRLNRSGGDWVPLDPLSLRVLHLARRLMEQSGAAFNCLVGGSLVATGDLPRLHRGRVLVAGVPADLELGEDRARLRRPVQVTLDGIAKGFAVDQGIKMLRRFRVPGGWINAGGDLRTFGPTGCPLLRREATGAIGALGRLRDAACATSTVRTARDQRFPGRIVDPSGRALPGGGTHSVLARHAWLADALTKVAAVSPPERRAAAVAALGGRYLPEPAPILEEVA